MTGEKKRLVTLPLTDGLEIQFGSAQELIAWTVVEQEAWQWIPQTTSMRREAQDTWRRFESYFNSVRQFSQEFLTDGQAAAFEEKLNRVSDRVKSKYIAIRGTPHGDRLIAMIVKNGGTHDEGARARALMAINWLAPGNDGNEMTVGQFRAATPALIDYYSEEGGSRATEASVTEMLRRAGEELTTRQAALDKCADEQRIALEAWQDDVRTAIRENSAGVESAIADLNNVKELFQTQMGLQAPVQYWTDKATSHKKAASAYRNTLIFVGITALVACLWAYFFVFNYVVVDHATIENSLSASLLAFGGLAVATTAALWITRILTRLYLSQHHLRIDAEERATMVTTYLALANEDAVGEKDRAIILAALFRPTADGIVKDDGPPTVMSPATVLGSMINPAR